MRALKVFKRTIFILFLLTITVGVAHAMVLSQATRCMLIDYYNFEKEGDLYYRAGLAPEKKEQLKQLISKAEERVALFWGERTAQPKFIYCENEEDFIKFGAPSHVPAAAILTFKSYVVINQNGVNLDILSHEISHTEFFERIGLINRELKIPTWFDEGLAMQVDLRGYYSLEELKKSTNNLEKLPDMNQYNSADKFFSGSHDEVILKYRTAKYEVGQWYSPVKLEKFIANIKEGYSFEEAYQ